MACEYSGTVRDAFIRAGHDARSCDLLPSESNLGFHYQEDIRHVLGRFGHAFDMLIAHPPCTDLAVSGAAHFPAKIADGRQQRALDFVRYLMNLPIEKIVIENPVSVISTQIRKPDQIIHPWQFGHPEQKTTCLWLKGVRPLKPTKNVYQEMMALPKRERERLHYLSPGPERWKERSKTFSGIAEAMAAQWGSMEEVFELEMQ